MPTIPSSTPTDVTDGAESHLKGEAYAHAVLDDDGSPAPPSKAASPTWFARGSAFVGRLHRRLRAHPVSAMAMAMGAGYLLGRVRARRHRHHRADD